MADASEQRIDGVDVDGMSTYLARSPVVFAVLFGSHARGTADDSSDVDVALGFPDEMTVHERFDARNRIDAELQEYAEQFVDVSDVESLPTPVAYAALRDGAVLVGDEQVVDAHRKRFERKYEAGAADRDRKRRAFIDRLARGDT